MQCAWYWVSYSAATCAHGRRYPAMVCVLRSNASPACAHWLTGIMEGQNRSVAAADTSTAAPQASDTNTGTSTRHSLSNDHAIGLAGGWVDEQIELLKKLRDWVANPKNSIVTQGNLGRGDATCACFWSQYQLAVNWGDCNSQLLCDFKKLSESPCGPTLFQ